VLRVNSDERRHMTSQKYLVITIELIFFKPNIKIIYPNHYTNLIRNSQKYVWRPISLTN
jgi:hypothetical protein